MIDTPEEVKVARVEPIDPDYCGLGRLNTGPYDPFWKKACVPHDEAFDKLKGDLKDPNEENLKAFGNFAANVGIGMLQGVFMAGMGIPYILVGGLGGLLRWRYLQSEKEE